MVMRVMSVLSGEFMLGIVSTDVYFVVSVPEAEEAPDENPPVQIYSVIVYAERLE